MVVFNIITQTVNPVTIIAMVVLILCFSHGKMQLVNFIVHFAFFVWVMSMIKVVFADPRPFWLTTEIKMLDWNCYQEFGNPSGHAMMGPIFFEFVFMEYLFPLAKTLCYKIFWVSLEVLFILTLIYSRLYLGMHGLNQILLGIAIGLVIIVYYRVYLNAAIRKFLQNIVVTDNKSRSFCCIMVAFCGMVALTMGFYYLEEYVVCRSHERINLYKTWKETINKQCNNNYKLLKSFHYKCFLDSTCLAVMFALPIAILLTKNKEFFTGDYTGDQSFL